MKLLDNSKELFDILEPKLVAIAKKCRVQDPAGEARSWFYRFSEILTGFDNGTYQKQYRDSENNFQILPDNPTPEIITLFQKSLFAYLKKSFKYEIFGNIRKHSRIVYVGSPNDIGYIVGQPIDSKYMMESEHDESEIIMLSDLLALINSDVKRAKANASISRDDLNLLFLKAISNYYSDLKETLGDFPIVKDYFSDGAREFFVYDLREGRTEGIRLQILKLAEVEPIRSVYLSCQKLAQEAGYYALNRKISRYFNDFLKGMPFRLKESKIRNNKIKKVKS